MALTYLHIQQKEAPAFEQAIKTVNVTILSTITIENKEGSGWELNPMIKYSLSLEPHEAFLLGVEFEKARRKAAPDEEVRSDQPDYN
jgi:hypothetical protein